MEGFAIILRRLQLSKRKIPYLGSYLSTFPTLRYKILRLAKKLLRFHDFHHNSLKIGEESYCSRRCIVNAALYLETTNFVTFKLQFLNSRTFFDTIKSITFNLRKSDNPHHTSENFIPNFPLSPFLGSPLIRSRSNSSEICY